MTMKLINILKESNCDWRELKTELQDRRNIPFEYGFLNSFDVHPGSKPGDGDDGLPMSVRFKIVYTSLGENMFTVAFKTLARFLSDFGCSDETNLGCVGYTYKPFERAEITMSPFISVHTRNMISYSLYSVFNVLRGNFMIPVNAELLPKMEHASDAYDTKMERARAIYEFLRDGTLEDGTSYVLGRPDFYIDTNEGKLKQGQEIHYEDLIARIFCGVTPTLNREQTKELISLFREYDVDLVIH